ncbi:MAG: class I tRNA ligase family protein, partial [Nanoarchaeota archaeon]
HDKEKELGTPLPWDKSQVVESLSDSTIYMAYYILAKYLEPNSRDKANIKPEQLKKEFFDFVLLGKGDIEEVSKITGIDKELLLKMKEEFDYWYPVDARHSGKDLIQNHLTFFIFHHVAIFDKEKWPRGIAVNGHVLLNGEKMSKSKGNIITTEWALNNWGAEITRFLVALAGDSTLDDGNLDLRITNRLIEELPKLIDLIPEIYNKKAEKENETIKKAFIAYFINKLKDLEKEADNLNFRTVITELYFNLLKELIYFSDYLGEDKKLLIEEWLKFFSIFNPHIAEEIWQKLSKKTLISEEEFKFNNVKIDDKFSKSLEYINNLIEKIREIKQLLEKKGNKINKVEIYLPTKENYELAKEIRELIKESKNLKELIQRIKKEKPELMREMKKIQFLFKNSQFLELLEVEEEIIKGFKDYIKERTGLEVEIKENNKDSLPGNLRFNLV